MFTSPQERNSGNAPFGPAQPMVCCRLVVSTSFLKGTSHCQRKCELLEQCSAYLIHTCFQDLKQCLSHVASDCLCYIEAHPFM